MPERQTSIQKRVRAVILLASVIILFVTAAAFVSYEVISFRANLVRNLSTLAAVIADNSAAPLAFDNRDVAEEILAAVRAEPDIEAALLFDKEGILFAAYPKGVASFQPPRIVGEKGYRYAEGGLIVFAPVTQEARPIGTLYLRSSFRGLYAQLWRYGLIVLVVLIGALAAAFLLSSLLQKRISVPILALTRAAETITRRGDYSVRAPKLTEDELGTLTDAFNRMLAETQENQARLAEQARLLNLTFDAILVRDNRNRVTYWNRGAEEMYGFTPEEALGKVSHELLRTQFSQTPEQIDEALRRDDRWVGELIHRRKDGGTIHVASRWTLDRGAQGQQPSTLEINTDITERKRADEEMRRTLEFNNAIMTGMGEGLYTVDRQGLVSYMNPAAEKLFGWSLAELRGRKMHDMTHYSYPDGTPFTGEACAGLQVLNDGKVLSGHEDVFIRKDGTFFDVVYSASPIRSGDAIVGLVVVFNDVSERKQTQEALAKSARQLRLMAELVPGFLAHVDADKKYLFVNSGYARFFGQSSAEDIVGRSVRDVTGEEAYRTIGPHLDEALEGRDVSYEFSVESPTQGRRYLRAAYVPFQDEQRKVTSLVGLVVDITANKAFEAELERQVQERTARLQETIGELEAFSYSISHDMRAPLRAMQGYARALLSDFGDRLGADAKLYLDRIFRSANRLDLLIQDVLAYSRVSKGEIELHPVGLEGLIDDIISTMPEFQEPNARVIIDRPLPPVMGHDAYLTQCVTNLLGNAVKFVSAGVVPEIRIRTERQNGKVRLWFEDNGIGVDPSHYERIFQIFGQVHPEKKYGGTGIGLAIVRKAVQRMNGEVGVESKIDKGSGFWLILNEVKDDD